MKRSGLNRLRYAYYCTYNFYYFLGCMIGGGVAIVILGSYFQYGFLPTPALLLISAFAGSFLTLLVLKTFLCLPRQPFRRAGLFGGLVAFLVVCWGLLFPLLGRFLLLDGLHAGIFAILTSIVGFQIARMKRIKIYPDRITIGKLVLYYRDMVEVKWGVGPLERTKQELTLSQQSKPLDILTPLLFESRGKDFSISYHYALIEMPTKIYVIQPVFWRNSFAQNVRNGWLEKWRWDGATEPPAEWVRPN